MVDENPFYGMTSTLSFFTQMGKFDQTVSSSAVESLLSNAYRESKTPDQKALFYSLVFAMGDIPNREHNLFSKLNYKKVDSGGQGKRKAFIYALRWMLKYDTDTQDAFYRLMPLIGEYSNLENLFYNQIRSNRQKASVITEELFLPIDIEKVTDYVASMLKSTETSDVTKTLWAKWLKAPRFRNRRHKYTVKPGTEARARKLTGNPDLQAGDTFRRESDMLNQTINKEKRERQFIETLCRKMNWAIEQYDTNVKYTGLSAFKAAYNRNTEAYLFSSGEIKNWDSLRFSAWLDQLPGGARHMVQKRLFNKDKSGKLTPTDKWKGGRYGDLADFYLAWEKGKEVAQAEQRQLEQKLVAKQPLSIQETDRLKELTKVAKVNTGASVDLLTVIKNLVNGGTTGRDAMINAEQLLRAMKLEVPVLVFGDRSGSMAQQGTNGIMARDVMAILVTAMLLKNPVPELGNIFGLYSDQCDIMVDNRITMMENTGNRFVMGNVKTVGGPIVDRTKSFVENWARVKSIINANERATGTDLTSVSRALRTWAYEDATVKAGRIETINQYPIWMFVTDTEFNNKSSVQRSMAAFRQEMLQNFGWNGVVVLWDVATPEKTSNDFSDMENVIHFSSSNVSTLNQIFMNISNQDVIDVYSGLLSFYRSNRYEPVRRAVLNEKMVNNEIFL